jgi:hypothetical protein
LFGYIFAILTSNRVDIDVPQAGGNKQGARSAVTLERGTNVSATLSPGAIDGDRTDPDMKSPVVLVSPPGDSPLIDPE